jgi:hypothetical protein
MSRRTGRSAARAAAKGWSDQSYHDTGWCAAERRYADEASARRFIESLATTKRIDGGAVW